MPNHLIHETSPYLRQHKDNPVDWYPWGEEALNKAKRENKPIFLSIGYAACHWCHVMAHESFENIETAKILNEHFVSIKVDREERPDLDDIYMQAVILLTGQGGWPMSVFLTPELKPFFGGTYLPPIPKHGMPSFNQVLHSVIDVWQNKRDAIESNARIITDAIQSQFTVDQPTVGQLDLDRVVESLYQNYDWHDGGWGKAPKFPQPMVLEFLIQRALRGNQKAYELANHALDRMARGGMYDLVGGGFHRYSTDNQWLIPHFEKMLYDNAQLALVYLHGYFLTGDIYFRQVAVRTLEFIQKEFSSPEGGFYASLDADTPEGEGRFYGWQYDQLQEQLSSEDLSFLQSILSIDKHGNFDSGLIVLQLKGSITELAQDLDLPVAHLLQKLESIFDSLVAIRSKRTPPLKDQKMITSWNALAIKAFAAAGLLLNRGDFLHSARRATDFILKEIRTPSGKLHHTWGFGKASQPGTLSDYAGMILALHAIYEVDFQPEIFMVMKEFFQIIQDEFVSSEGLYYDAAESVSNLIVRPKNIYDNVAPSGNALAGHAHWLFANYQEDVVKSEKISTMLGLISENAQKYPTSLGYWLTLSDLYQQSITQVALIINDKASSLKPFLDIYREKYRPYSVIAARIDFVHPEEQIPVFLHNREPHAGKTTAYVCQGFTCQQPTTDPDKFKEQLAFDA